MSIVIGDIPASWEVARLDDVADLLSGGTPSRLRPEWWQGSIPWASPKDMKRLRLRDTLDHISEEALQSGSRLVPAGTIFVVIRGMILAKELPVAMAEVPMAFNQDMKAVLPRPAADSDYLLYAIASRRGALTREIGTSAHGTRRMGTSSLEDLLLPLPPKDEQKAIAAVLLKIQTAIEVQERIVTRLKQLKAATMAKLFREGLRGEPLKQTEIGEVPESWTIVPLSSIASIERGQFAHRPRNDPRFYGGTVPFIQTGDVAKANGRVTAHTQTLNELGLAVSRLFPKGTVVLTIAANIADTAILDFDAAFPDSLVGIRPTTEVDPAFLEHYLRTQKPEMNRLAPKGTQKNINIQFLKPWPVPVPSPVEQQAIAHILGSLDRRLELASKTHDALKFIFSSMLHLLMTGAVRVTHEMIARERLRERIANRKKWTGVPDERTIHEIVQRIVEVADPEKIVLFGSAARGEMGPDSDLDFLVVKAGVDRRETANVIRRSLIGLAPGLPKDVIVVTPEDIERHRNTIGYIIRPALREGKVVYAA